MKNLYHVMGGLLQQKCSDLSAQPRAGPLSLCLPHTSHAYLPCHFPRGLMPRRLQNSAQIRWWGDGGRTSLKIQCIMLLYWNSVRIITGFTDPNIMKNHVV